MRERTRRTRRRAAWAALPLAALAGPGCAAALWHNTGEDSQVVQASLVRVDAAAAPQPMATRIGGVPPGDVLASSPLDTLIRHALAENREVQAARADVLALKERIPQVTALEDPTTQNTIFPFPSNGPQYSLMGYMPYDLMITQQFPWFGTLRLRGISAGQEVRSALFALATRQLEVVASVKQSYYELAYNRQADEILGRNRTLAEDVAEIARVRYRAANSGRQDVLRAEAAVAELDRERIDVDRGLAESRAALAEQLHVDPKTRFDAPAEPVPAAAPAALDRLHQLAVASRPELQTRLANLARDETEVALARKQFYPTVDLGIAYNLMTRRNAASPTADGRDNVGFVVGFNLPIYRKKYQAAVCEAQARALADARRYEADRDRTFREITDLFAQARSQSESARVLRDEVLSRREQALELAANDYRAGNSDYVSLNTARQDVLRVQLQVARLEADLGQSLARLEQAVGVQLGEHPPTAPPPAEAPPPSTTVPGPFPPAAGEEPISETPR
jgi:cobalt-zinc-cadmium efflux system outer membrane protein